MARKPILAGNWKMFKTIEDARMFALDIRAKGPNMNIVDVSIFPPYTMLKPVAIAISGSGIEIGAQNMHFASEGAYTGEISPSMLLDSGCNWVILGHSERRKYFSEDDETIAAKLRAALNAELKPIVCVGETLEERQQGKATEVVGKQLSGAFSKVGLDEVSGVVIAYEPVWAIGTGVVATAEQAAEMHAFIRQTISQRFGMTIAQRQRILYGGSINPCNIASLISLDDVDGGLIGGASLAVDSFFQIIEKVIDIYRN